MLRIFYNINDHLNNKKQQIDERCDDVTKKERILSSKPLPTEALPLHAEAALLQIEALLLSLKAFLLALKALLLPKEGKMPNF